jgi:hypothetical protein
MSHHTLPHQNHRMDGPHPAVDSPYVSVCTCVFCRHSNHRDIKMPVHRSEPRRYRAQIAPMGIPQYRRQPRSQSSSQASSDAYDHLRDLSPPEPSVPLIPAHISGTQLTDIEEEPSSDGELTTVDFAHQDHSMDQDTESNRSDTHSQRDETSLPDKL